MDRAMFGEFMGTLILILLGNGVVANVLLRKSKGEDAGWIVITAGWAFAVMAGVFTAAACGSPDGHLNPAVTLGAAFTSGNFSKFGGYLVAQMAGAMIGASLVWLYYLPHWRETPEPERKLACFCTSPAIRMPAANFLSEVIGTFVLVVVAGAIGSKVAPGIGPYLVGCVVWSIGLSLGGTTGYAINPARDLGPRIAHAILPVAKKGPSDWGYALIPVLGPLVGGALAGVFVKIVF